MNSFFRIRCLLFLICCTSGVTSYSWAATINAASCSQSNVSSAISSAAVGDTVQVPAGVCSWSGLSISKAIHLKGAGVGQTKITLTGSNSISKQSAGITRVSGFSFSKSGGGNQSKGWTIDGSWQSAEPVIFQNNDFIISNSGLFRLNVAGGVIIANNSFTGGWDDSFIQPKDSQDGGNSWATADTMGSKDTTGKRNIYVENNSFYGGTNAGIDCDDSTRCVYRYNTLTFSSFNSHGMDTSPVGIRHFEVYNNEFIHNGGTSQIANQNWAVWIRGGTGVIFNNQIADLAGSYWGNKSELKMSIRGAEDVRPQGSCSNVKYPVPRQLGQNHNGSNYFTDPIYIWGNSGATATSAGWNWGNPCGLNWNIYFQWGRDAVNGIAKPGYSPYTYPHPLLSGGTPAPTDTSAPSVPSAFQATVASSSQISLSWTASTDNIGVTGYRLERCTGASCTNYVQIGTASNTSYSNSGLTAGTTYRYRVRASDAAGNLSGYSTVANATTPAQTGGGDTSAPSVPSGIQATVVSSSQISLSWTASTDNVGVTGYRLERCTGSTCTNYVQIGTPANTSYSNSGLTAGTTYRYRVRATDAAGNLSGYSAVVNATTPAQTGGGDTTAPSVPSNFQATVGSSSQISLSWTASTDNVGVTGYRLERCTGSNCANFVQIATPSNTSYSNSGLTASTTYRYRIRATDAAGNLSGYSAVVNATTPAQTSGNVYYIDQTAGNDNNAGTAAQPWKNAPGMNGQSAHTGNHSLSPGDTVYFDRNDTWTVSGSPQGFYLVGGVRYIGDDWQPGSGATGSRAEIRAGNDFNNNGVIRFRDHATIQTLFKGFEVNANGMSANGIDINHGFWSLMNGATKRVENVEVHHVFTEQSKGEYKYGIAMSNWGGSNGILQNVEIVNCSVHDIGRSAIVLYPSDDPSSRIGNIVVRGCEVYNTGQDPGYDEGHGIVVKGWVYNSTIENNYIHNVNSSAIFVSGPENDGNQRSADNVVVRNNILTTQDNNGIIRLYKKGSKNLNIYGNIIFDNSSTGGLNLGGNSGTLDLLVYNNTFYNTFVDLGSHSSSVNTFEFKNNIIQYSSNQLRNSGAIRSQSNNLLVSSNPGFKNPSNKPTGFVGQYGVDLRPNADGLSLISGNGINGGAALANAYSGSINSVPRPQGPAWDIGAYEFSSVAVTSVNPPLNLRINP